MSRLELVFLPERRVTTLAKTKHDRILAVPFLVSPFNLRRNYQPNDLQGWPC